MNAVRSAFRPRPISRTMSTSGKATMFAPADRLAGFDAPTVWGEFTPLAKEANAVNLGQGFPDWPAPAFLKRAATAAIQGDVNQYARSQGHPALVEALAKRYGPEFGRELDPMSEVTISIGASEALFAAMQALVNPGDEVVVLEPCFDIYIAQIKLAGGVCKHVPLKRSGSDEWKLDVDDLRAAMGPRTRALILNTPHNPTGKMFSREELEEIAAVVQDHPDCVVVTDEVYEHITFDGRKHERMAAVPGMWDRTLTVSSAGKSFSCTGWKIGWLLGPTHLIKPVMLVNQWIQFAVTTPLQEAVAQALDDADQPYEGYPNYYEWLRATYTRKRQVIADALREAGIEPIMPQGSIFVMGDTSRIEVPDSYLAESTPAAPTMTRDWALCRYLTIEHGVTAIPPSAFYSAPNKHHAGSTARFAMCKTDDSLATAVQALRRIGERTGSGSGSA